MRQIALLFATLVSLALTGCRQLGLDQVPVGRYTRPELAPVTEPRDPVVDFVKLSELARGLDLRLYDEHEDTVHWRDMQLFRVYEFSHYSVLIFPLNWHDGRFEITVVAGKLRDRTVPVRALTPVYSAMSAKPSHRFAFPAAFAAWGRTATRVGLDGACLSDPRDRCYAALMDYFLGKNPMGRDYYEKMWQADNSMVAYVNTGRQCRYEFYYFVETLQFMRIFCDYTRDPLLAHYGLDGTSCTVVAEGTFSLKALIAAGQLPPPVVPAPAVPADSKATP